MAIMSMHFFITWKTFTKLYFNSRHFNELFDLQAFLDHVVFSIDYHQFDGKALEMLKFMALLCGIRSEQGVDQLIEYAVMNKIEELTF